MTRSIVLCIALITAIAAAHPALAQSFNVRLGQTSLGVLSFDAAGPRSVLRSTLTDTPLGVFNGTFNGVSEKTGAAQKFTGVSQSSRKSRQVSTVIDQGRAVQTNVTPEKERTDLSDIDKVPQGVVDPVIAIGGLINASGGCPKGVHIYDGRRAIALAPQESAQDGDTLTCKIAYTVIAGPGHLSPLRISSARMRLSYDVSGGGKSSRR
ncbi:hypothetical protein [Sulfitobacter aestuariivivens]|uniref:hypothetical protein n=1 Tax=Sulfitobacter aestuariivivens TaxID=2766981 RepID=UPI00360D9340